MIHPHPMPEIRLDARDPAGGDAFGDLPDWNLSDLYPSTDGPEITEDMQWLETECAAFAGDYEGKLTDLTAEGLLTCVQRYENIQSITGRVMSFAGLRYYQNTTDPDRAKFMADAQAKIRMKWRNSCMINPLWEPPHGTVCSMKPWPG